ncbi:MAG: hypothetical protein ACPGWR_22710 [Ardenticatenaceae bacterium]
MADILYLVERLEQVLAQGWRVPLTTNAVIDEDAFIDIVEQMHIAIPNEIREAQQIVQQKERILAQAREEAERLLEHAYQQADRLIAQTDMVKRARTRANDIITEAGKEAEDIRFGADYYAAEVLKRLRKELEVYMQQVDNGLERLKPEEPVPDGVPAQALTFDETDVEDFLQSIPEDQPLAEQMPESERQYSTEQR